VSTTNTTTVRHVDRETVQEWAATAARAADDKQGRDTLVLDVGSVHSFTDYFVLTSGLNSRQVRTIADEVELKVRESGGPSPRQEEGRAELSWVLLDYGDFIVHVFLDETRRFYEIERLYPDAPVKPWR
jgi:ribosome-associated protein